jgi:hypothetical protein
MPKSNLLCLPRDAAEGMEELAAKWEDLHYWESGMETRKRAANHPKCFWPDGNSHGRMQSWNPNP